MIDNVVDLFPEDSGYVVTDGRVDGVYNGNLAAYCHDGEVSVGHKAVCGIDYPVSTSIDELNRFCIMWLAIHDSGALNYDD